MPTDTTYSDVAISNIIYFGGNNLNGDCGCDGKPKVSVIPDYSYLGYLEPEEMDIAFIMNGSNGGIDVGIYFQGNWIIKPLKGQKGDKGDTGSTGLQGLPGVNGSNGINGATGAQGLPPEHRWDGTKLQFKNPNGSWGTFVDLKGQAGTNGTNGQNGAKGDMPAHEWSGTKLKFQLPTGSWGSEVDLKGTAGATGGIGPAPAHEWNPSNNAELRFQQSDGSWGTYHNLRGPQGPKGDTGAKGEIGQTGATGAPGQDGSDGMSAYDLAVSEGTFTGTLAEYLESLKGADGAQGPQGIQGPQGPQGLPGQDGQDGQDGLNAVANLQKIITADYTIKPQDNNYVIFVDNGTADVRIFFTGGMPDNFNCGFIQLGTGLVTFEDDNTTTIFSFMNNFAIQGQYLGCFAEKVMDDERFILMGNLIGV